MAARLKPSPFELMTDSELESALDLLDAHLESQTVDRVRPLWFVRHAIQVERENRS